MYGNVSFGFPDWPDLINQFCHQGRLFGGVAYALFGMNTSFE
jgi:hypothetical protein